MRRSKTRQGCVVEEGFLWVKGFAEVGARLQAEPGCGSHVFYVIYFT